jgi:ribosomal protein S18 acetylase RimI-like enzyme
MAITVRTATPADVPTIVEFNRLMALETENKKLDPAILTAGVAAAVADPNKIIYYLAEENGQILAQLGVTTEWSDWRNGWQWWIQSVYVIAEARRRGLYRRLYQHVVENARKSAEVIGIYLYVDRDNQAAQETYTNLGMELTDYLIMQHAPL